MIPQHEIDELKSRADIVDIIGDYVSLKKRGAGYVGCCPFHQEKTGSFHVSPSRNIYKCFGCGESGNIFKFIEKKEGVSFPEAVKVVAEKCHFTLHEQAVAETEKQRDDRLHRESVLVQMAMAQDYFEANLKNPDEEAVAALTYAKSRWKLEDIEEQGLGYAYMKGNKFLEYAQSKCMSLAILRDCGLLGFDEEHGRYYDFFRGRLMMPIYDRYKHVIAYTARVIPERTDKPNKDGKVPGKYINSSDTILYKKSETLYGLNVAWNAAAREKKCYCVEGGPDALRLHTLGFDNTVACLGADWTPGQMELLRKRCDTLCFIPDADPPKYGAQYGIGVEKVIKAGRLAFQFHFKVFVKEIGTDGEGKKRDADSLFKTAKMFTDDFEEEDYIFWYARKLFPQTGDTQNQNVDLASGNVAIIAEILSFLDEGFELDHYIDNLNKLHPGKITWRNAIIQARLKRKQEEMERNLDEEEKLLASFGFGIEHRGYYSLNTQGGHYDWSNFTMKPLYFIRDQQSAIRLYEMQNQDGQKEFVELRQEDLISLARFKQKVESLGNYIWFAKEDQLTKLKMYLYKVTASAELITQLGWQRGGFFAFSNGIYYNGQWYAVDEYGIVKIQHTSADDATEMETSNYYLPPYSKLYVNTQSYEWERKFVHKGHGNISLFDYAKMLISVFGDHAKIGLCFLFATLFRDIIVEQTKWFPILNLFGPKNSGKSELGHSLMSFFIIENLPPNIENSTIAALSDAVAQVSNALVHLDEFKDSVDITKREFLKGLWDGTGRNRMNMDRDKKREVTKVDAGIIISGQEMATQDIALFTRFVFLGFEPFIPTPERTERFEKLAETRKLGCSHLTLEILQYRPVFEQQFRGAFKQVLDDIQTRMGEYDINVRILKNWVVPIAAFQSLRNHLQLPFTLQNLEDIACKGMKIQSEKCMSNQEVGVWWDIVYALYTQNKIYRSCHFRVEPVHELAIEESKEKLVYPLKPKWVLYIRVKPIFELYLEHAKKTGQKVLPKASLDFYLEHCAELIGSKRAVRFDKIVEGVVQFKLDAKGNATNRKDSFTDQVLCYDYDLLKEHFNINLL